MHIIAAFSISEPDMRGGFGESFMSFRRSMRLGSKKSKDKPPANAVPQSSFEEKNEEEEEEKDEEEVCQEMEETYTLPDIPHTPLSGTVSHTHTVFYMFIQEV